MKILHLLAHADDEYGAYPLIAEFARRGASQTFVFLTEPVRGAPGARRRAESRAMLRMAGVRGAQPLALGADRGIDDGALLAQLGRAKAGLADLTLEAGRPDLLITPAWEGGHVDHDLTAALSAWLAGRWSSPPPIWQFSLYNGWRTPGPIFRGATFPPQAGPTETLPLTAAQWWAYAAAVRCFVSQAPVWSTLWPAMFAGFARHGFRYQPLRPERLRERPHPGPLLYERRGLGRYATTAAAVADLLTPEASGAPRTCAEGR
jgi:LmbE family N-acetylglucosaminyl deacetylase